MAEIRWSAEAERWLQQIYEYIAADNADAAHRVVVGIHKRATILATFPEIGHRYRDDRDVRILLYGRYRIAYLIKSNRDIDILGVFHGSLDIKRYLA